MSRVPVSTPDLSDVEKSKLIDAFDSGWISANGKYSQDFEKSWAEETGSEYSLLVANGTVALHLILASLNIGPGDEVIVPTFTYIASVNAIKYVGATPVFCDADPETWNMDFDMAKSKVTSNTKAIIFVHLYGNPTGATAFRTLCDEKGIYLIEDAAEAPFASEAGRMAGSFGHVASFSFFGNKIISSGEGGAVTTSDPKLYARMKLLRDQGMSPERRYFFPEIGFNFRLTNLQAAILAGQLERKSEMMEKRQEVVETYTRILGSSSIVEFQKVGMNAFASPWLFSFRLNSSSLSVADLSEKLGTVGIETRPLFIPIHFMPPYKDFAEQDFPVAVSLNVSGISLPTSSTLKIETAAEIGHEVLSWIDEKTK